MPATIRSYRPGDETRLVALFARVFGRPITGAHWRWKLAARASPVPNVFVGVVQDEAGGERLVHQSAGIPVRYSGPGGEVTAVVAVDAMTDPAFRRQGLLTEACRVAYDRWRDAGVAFVVGLPNQQWGSRARALGWREVSPLVWRVRPLCLPRLAARRFGALAGSLAAPAGWVWNSLWRRHLPGDASIRVRRVLSADVFDRLWRDLEHGAAPRTTWSIVRDRAWIEWRYLAAPDADYVVRVAERAGEPVGYCVSRLRDVDGRRIGYIAELAAVADEPAVLRVLLADAVGALDREGADLVAALAVPDTALDRALRRAGFLFSWGRFSMEMVPLGSEAVVPLSGVCGGDFDVV